ncbi:MAG TPA: hypothetical protein VND21_00435 [Planctomycetota bacterium]|nr:hypothetical protein [Planctomycetota bacterium]
MDRLRDAPSRVLLVALVAAVALLIAAVRADAEEAFVLDNGSVLRGVVLRDDGAALEIRLSGRGMRGTVMVERTRIVQRFVTQDPEARVASRTPAPEGPYVRPAPSAEHATPPPPAPAEPTAPLLAAVPSAHAVPTLAEERFVDRFLRRASSAVPAGPGPRAFLVGMALAVLTALVALGARMAEIDDATLGRCTVVAFLLGAVVGFSATSAGSVLRADVAPLAVPVALLVWAGLASAVFRCGFGRAFTLLAFVLLAGSLVVFTAGVVITAV